MAWAGRGVLTKVFGANENKGHPFQAACELKERLCRPSAIPGSKQSDCCGRQHPCVSCGGATQLSGDRRRRVHRLQLRPLRPRPRAGAEVTNLDLLTYAGVQATVDELDRSPAPFRARRHPRLRSRRPAGPGHDVVVHFAAESHVDRSITGPAVFLETNVVGTGMVLDAARRHRGAPVRPGLDRRGVRVDRRGLRPGDRPARSRRRRTRHPRPAADLLVRPIG